MYFSVSVYEVGASHEKRLIRDLLTRYKSAGRVGRPVNDSNEGIDVEYGLSMIQILDLDERNQVLTTNVWGNYVSVLDLETLAKSNHNINKRLMKVSRHG